MKEQLNQTLLNQPALGHCYDSGVTVQTLCHAKINPGSFWCVVRGSKNLILLPRMNIYHSLKVPWVYFAKAKMHYDFTAKIYRG